MPMYKKPLLILLSIALLAIVITFYGYSTTDSKDTTINLESSPITSEAAQSQHEITVYVSGEINSPGVITLNADSRISDAVNACGGFTPVADKNNINLAQKLEDGMQIKVPAIDNSINNKSTSSNNTPNTSSQNTHNKSNTDNATKVNINIATEADLDTLPGVGPAMAKRIVEYRNTNGNFKSIDEIKNVKGIGDAKFSKMQDRITI